MRFFIVKTNNYMTTTYYYNVLLSACQKIDGCEAFLVDSITSIKKAGIKKEDYVITGHVKDATLLLLKGYKNVIVWCQGVIPEERKMQNEKKWKILLDTVIERFACKHCSFFIFVSDAQRQHFMEKYQIRFDNKNYYIMPCFNEEKIIPNNFVKNDDEIVFSYTGGLGTWQCIEQTLEIYKKLEGILNKTRLLFFTNAVERATALIEKHKIINYECRYVLPENLSKELKNANFGFVLREDNIVNKVATPTKFSTYLANGVIPIYTSYINSFSDVMKCCHYKIELDSLETDYAIKKICSFLKEGISVELMKNEYANVFKSYYGTDYHINNIKMKFSNLIANPIEREIK